MTREYPWHQRRALLKHHRWFRNLVDFHAITQAWVKEAGVNLSSAPYLTDDLKTLESVPDARLELLLDDTAPEDLLARLESSVLAAQGWTYSALFAKAGAKADALKSVLEQTTWKQGKLLAESRWNRISEVSRNDLRAIFLTLVDSPMALSLGENAFLLKRGLPDSVEFEFRNCPHVLQFPEEVRDTGPLCGLHSSWIRGYLYGMNNLAQLEYVPCGGTQKRCAHHWHIGGHVGKTGRMNSIL